ncbi:MAG: TGS domain-containing protein, partial [Clostridia bacterium]|nr:TGS domain-containing protein [Clostridia bacterium]
MKIVLKNGDIIEKEEAISAFELAKSISEGLAKAGVACKINGNVCAMSEIIDKDCDFEVLTFADEEGRKVYRHTCSHILAQAVKNIFPTAKLAIGPAIENGFYYDIDFKTPITFEDLERIEKEMKAIIKAKYTIERFELPRGEALKLMSDFDEPYKVELINDLPEDAVISFY